MQKEKIHVTRNFKLSFTYSKSKISLQKLFDLVISCKTVLASRSRNFKHTLSKKEFEGGDGEWELTLNGLNQEIIKYMKRMNKRSFLPS